MRDKTFHCERGETRRVTRNWAQECERQGATLASSTWAWAGSGTISNASQSGYVSSVTIDPQSSGVLKCVGTFANGEVICAWRQVLVTVVYDGSAPEDEVLLIAAEDDEPVEGE